MGRHFEVRAKAMEATAKKKSALYMRASKEVYVAAKSGLPDPNSNLALRSVIEKYRTSVPRDVIDRAIKKAAGGEETTVYTSGRYEAFGPGNSLIVVDTLSDNTNRAFSEVRALITKRGGHLGSVIYNFDEYGNFVFHSQESLEALEEALILGDVDLQEITKIGNDLYQCFVTPSDYAKTRNLLKNDLGIKDDDFELSEINLIPQNSIKIDNPEDKEKFLWLIEQLEENEDVQAVYHNVEME